VSHKINNTYPENVNNNHFYFPVSIHQNSHNNNKVMMGMGMGLLHSLLLFFPAGAEAAGVVAATGFLVFCERRFCEARRWANLA
jgi:hypothetical protein